MVKLSRWVRRTLLLSAAALFSGASAVSATAQEIVRTERVALFLFQYAPGPTWRAGVPMREQGLGPHAAYMQRLQNEGRLFAGGGYASDDGGMAIVMAADENEARAMLAADPAIASGIFVATLRHWRPRFRADDPLPASN